MKFKDILAWVKSHIVIVISCILILAVLPTAFFFSKTWHEKLLKNVQTKADAELAKTKVSVTYALPKVDPKVQPVTMSGAPNQKLTDFFAKTREQMLAEVEKLSTKGANFNRGVGPQAQGVGRSEFKPLVDGLFPKPALTPEQIKQGASREVEQIKLNDMEDSLLGKAGKPNPYQQLLDGIRAGQPPSGEHVFQILKDVNDREKERITANSRELTPEEQKALAQLLKDRRLGEYQAIARSLGVYADINIFPSSGGADASGSRRPADSALSLMPTRAIPAKQLNLGRVFIWQWDLWTLSDFFNAVRLANTGKDGKLMGVDQGVVKRILNVQITQPEDMKSLAKETEKTESTGFPDTTTTETPVVPDPPIDQSKSVVGWIRSGGNNVYEVRSMRVRLIASSARLNQFIDSLQRTNFIAVTDLDLTQIDPWEHLAEGYFYGDEHVVQVDMTIESAWLTSWLLPLMPADLQVALGRTPPAETPAEGAEAAPTEPK